MKQLSIFDASGAPLAPPHAAGAARASASDPGAAERRNALTRARHDDPESSKLAAARAGDLAREHQQRILEALDHAGPTGGTIYELAARTGLTHVQVARRLPELAKLGLACPTKEVRIGPSGRGCRVWRLV